MIRKSCYVWLMVSVLPVILVGCKESTDTAANGGGATMSAEDIAATRDALVKGMREIAVSQLGTAHMGKRCVVTAGMPAGGYKPAPPPPPPGMIRLMGQTVIYCGAFDKASEDSITVRAGYPTPGNYKHMDILKADVQSCHIAR